MRAALDKVPLYLAPKLALCLAMRDSGTRNTELAKRLGVSETVVRRMLDPSPTTKPERIQAALTEPGKRGSRVLEDLRGKRLLVGWTKGDEH